MKEILKRSETMVNIQENIEMLPIHYVIYNMMKKHFISTVTHNEYGFDNSLNITKNCKKF